MYTKYRALLFENKEYFMPFLTNFGNLKMRKGRRKGGEGHEKGKRENIQNHGATIFVVLLSPALQRPCLRRESFLVEMCLCTTRDRGPVMIALLAREGMQVSLCIASFNTCTSPGVSKVLHVRNVSAETSHEELVAFVSQFGSIVASKCCIVCSFWHY
jgi:hypothetical protein